MIIPSNSGITAPRGAYYAPTVIEQDGRGNLQAYDVYSRLLRDRIIFLGTAIDDYVANSVIAQMLFLQMDDAKKDIHVYINSGGDDLPEISDKEEDFIDRAENPRINSRLACQCVVEADMQLVVTIPPQHFLGH